MILLSNTTQALAPHLRNGSLHKCFFSQVGRDRRGLCLIQSRRIAVGVGVEGPSRGDPVMGWIIMGCSVRSDNLFLAQLTLPQRGCVGSALRRSRQAAGPDPVV